MNRIILIAAVVCVSFFGDHAMARSESRIPKETKVASTPTPGQPAQSSGRSRPKEPDQARSSPIDNAMRSSHIADDHNIQQDIRNYTKGLSVYTGVLAVATIGLLIVGLVQAHLIRITVRDTGRAATAAQQSADIARDALTKRSRAFVLPRGITYLSHLDERTGKYWWSITINWENAGDTPTRNMRINVNSYLGETPLPSDFTFPQAGGPSVPVFVGPRATIGGSPINKVGEELEAVRSRNKYFYIWGSARYRDVFEGTPEHVTRFAYQVDVLGDFTLRAGPTNVVQLNLNLLEKHNCVDEECSGQ